MFHKKIALLLAVMATLLVIAACAAQPQTQTVTVVETVVVEKEVETIVEKEVVKEVEVEKLVEVQGPIPYPDGVPLGLEDVNTIKLTLDQWIDYRAMDSYNEPEWVSELVAAGDLPPVEERLPKEPQVILTASMEDGIGVYGDSFRGFSACPTSGWNYAAGVSAGWFGIESYSSNNDSLVKTGPLYRMDQDVEPIPNLAKSWEWSDDGLELTMHLIEGAKWSDGEPFTSADVIFTFEDMISDPNVNSWKQIDNWSWDGVPATLEAVDDYTIKWTFPVPFPKDKYYFMDEQDFSVAPAHILKDLHPKYKADTDYKEFENVLGPDVLPQVTMGPYAAVEYKTDELLIMRRNPYFWKVDEAGNQLPYMDEVIYQKGGSGVGRDLCTMAGGCDHANLENPSTFVEVLKRAQEEDAHFSVNWAPELLGYDLTFNLSNSLGVNDDRDAAVRELFRNVNFRKAMSYATDREGIAQSIMRGPFLRPWPGGLMPGAPDYDKESVVYYPTSLETAKTLLAEIGLEDTDGDGTLNYTEGPIAGENVIITMGATEDQAEAVTTAEALVSNWAEVGIKVNFRPQTSAARQEEAVAGTWDTHVHRTGREFGLPHTRCNDVAPISKTSPHWHREGDTPRELLDFEPRIIEIINEYCTSGDPVRKKELMYEYNQIITENVYFLGIYMGRHGLASAQRLKNIPQGTPVVLYQWVEDVWSIEQQWTPVEEQREQIRPNTVPVYSN
jgi:peptide/nickel transport system substrate-binding protein